MTPSKTNSNKDSSNTKANSNAKATKDNTPKEQTATEKAIQATTALQPLIAKIVEGVDNSGLSNLQKQNAVSNFIHRASRDILITLLGELRGFYPIETVSNETATTTTEVKEEPKVEKKTTTDKADTTNGDKPVSLAEIAKQRDNKGKKAKK